MVDGIGWVSCDKNDPEASEDLNRLYVDATWDTEKQRWINSKGSPDEKERGEIDVL